MRNAVNKKNNKQDKRARMRRGFSVAEVIIALTVVVIVSGAATSLIISHSKLEAATVETVTAANIAENAIECYRFAVRNGNGEDFEALFESTFHEAPDLIVSENKISGTAVVNGMTYHISLDTGAENKITVTVSDADDDELITQSYTRPDTENN